jgi:hypothetical protein
MTNKFYKIGSTYIFILLLLFGIFIVVIGPMISSNLMNKKSKYAISDGRLNYIVGLRSPETTISYEFTVNGKLYSGRTSMDGFLHYHYYFVRFYPDNPNFNSIEPTEASWYDIKGMPASGFDSIPKH